MHSIIKLNSFGLRLLSGSIVPLCLFGVVEGSLPESLEGSGTLRGSEFNLCESFSSCLHQELLLGCNLLFLNF